MEKIKELWNHPKSRWTIIGVAAGVVAVIALLIILLGGGNKLENATITIYSEIEAPLADVGIYVYSDASQKDMLTFVKTDAEGVAKLDKSVPEGSVIVLSGVPKGYAYEASYTLTQADTKLVLEIELLKEMTTVAAGDIMFDFTVTDTEGQEYTLSKLLEEKAAVVLNFWFAGCGPCQAEFPSLLKAYETHGQNVAVLAMNPTEESLDVIKAFKSEYGLTFPVVKCDAVWAQQYYPTTIVIDRYGIVSMIHVGSVVAEGVFEGMFAHFSKSDYKHQVIEDIIDLKINVEPTAPTTDPESGLLEISGAEGFQVTVAPGQKVECDVYKVSGMTMKIEDENAVVTYQEKEYKAENGVVEVEVLAENDSKPVHIAIGNAAEEEKTFEVSFYHRDGSAGKPLDAVMGTLNVELEEGNAQGMYYAYKAEETGMLVVECNREPSVKYDYALVNLRTNKRVTYSKDGTLPEETKLPTLQIEVTAGDEVHLIVTTVEDKHPAAKLSFMCYMEQPPEGTTDATEPTQTLTPDASKYQRIVDEKLLVSGKYVIVANGEYAMGAFSAGVVKTAEPKIKEHTVTDSKHAVWELIQDGKKFKLKNADGKYLAPKGGNNNGLILSDTAYSWEIAFEYGAIQFTGTDKDTVTLASYKSDDYNFNAYKNEVLEGENAAKYYSRFYLYRLDDGKFQSKLEGTTEGKLSNPDAPVEIGGTLHFETVDIGLGEQVQYHIYRVGGTTMSIKSKNAYVIYNKKTYTPNSSGYIYISMPTDDPTVPVILSIGNSGVELERFDVNFYYPAGSRENPHDYVVGETLTTDIKAGNDQGIFYSFRAPAAGTLTISFVDLPEGAAYGITVTTQGTIPVQQAVQSTEGTSVSIQLAANEKVEIIISTLPVNGRYPKASIKTIGKFE